MFCRQIYHPTAWKEGVEGSPPHLRGVAYHSGVEEAGYQEKRKMSCKL